jgi:peptidoglycan/xylan/chitin deacetylase (PgdA/CDA1 family)
MKRLPPGWYILLYHEISWEENCYIRGTGGCCPPDLFREHVGTVRSLGDLVSIEDGMRALAEDRITRPLFSFWLDDGLIGAAKYALPILDEFGVTGAISICSRFVDRGEFFWRFKLSYLNSVDGMRFLRSRLKRFGFQLGDSIKQFTLQSFSREVLAEIDDLFLRWTTAAQREDAYRMFLDRDAVRMLRDRGWCVANHSAGHYPVSQDHSLALLGPEFQECETAIREISGNPSRYWVLPFDHRTSQELIRVADSCREDRYLVFVGNRRNTVQTCLPRRTLYRYGVPIAAAEGLFSALSEDGVAP